MEQQKSMTFRWLQVLFYFHLVSAAMTLLFLVGNVFRLSLSGEWVTWANRVISLGTVLCLFMLPGKFLPAAIARVGLLLCSLFPMLLPNLLGLEAYIAAPNILQWVSPVLTVLAIFLEYHAHAMTVPENANRWHLLTLVSLCISLVSMLLLPTLEEAISEMVQNGNTWCIRVYNAVVYLLTLALDGWYLTLLQNNLQMLENKD